MRSQAVIIGFAFFIFGVVAWVLGESYSPVWLGLMAFGVATLALGFTLGK
jgi:hypothetical protein